MISRYSVTAEDTMDNSTYYLYQEPIGGNEAWGEIRQVVLHQLDRSDSFLRKIILVPFVPDTVPYFFMKVTFDAVYCLFVSIEPLIVSTFAYHEKRYGGREIVLVKINKTDMSYIAHSGVSTVGHDDGVRLEVETDGSVFIIGTTNADIASPWGAIYAAPSNLTIFVTRFQSFGISSFVTPISLSNALGYRIQESKNFSVVFTQDVTQIAGSLWIQLFLRDGSTSELSGQFDSINNLVVTAPQGGGKGLSLMIGFWDYPHHPMTFNHDLSYDPPYIDSVAPLNGPTTGGTQLRL
ncbi:hypothetical protein BKA69DRAFT_1100392 [Paraphysoderma sedebokerense]|nr:hypothetical protein BKA69DRAFT_1100392 [Paraphysoderma sedebokerense]